MTREEAIMWLNAERKARCKFGVLGEGSLLVEALDMAIEALSADIKREQLEVGAVADGIVGHETITKKAEKYFAEHGDLISRADAVEAVQDVDTREKVSVSEAVKAINALPSAEAPKPTGDLISRADAIELLTKIVFDEPPYLDSETLCRLYAEEQINALPSAEAVQVVRCKDCKWWGGNKNTEHNNHICNRALNQNVDYWTRADDFCSYGERAEQTKYPATYNIDPKCLGCVHLDEFGRCLNFMLAKADRSCWQCSWSDEPLFNDITEEVGRPHGEWQEVDGTIVKTWSCSRCGNITSFHTDYCAVCGADMRGDNNE